MSLVWQPAALAAPLARLAPGVATVGWRPVALMVAQTLFLAALFAVALAAFLA